MRTFEYVNPSSVDQALSALGPERAGAAPIAGGIDLLGELKERTFSPARLVNLKGIAGLDSIEASGASGLKIGALVTLAALAERKEVAERWPGLAQAALSVGTPQIRNFGTVGGNLCQRPRCWYYRASEFHCLKKGGAKCFAVEGENKYHAIFGPGPCHIVHPSDLAPILIALNATARVAGRAGGRDVPLDQFYVMPDKNIFGETVLKADEIVTEVSLPPNAPASKSVYVKF